MGCGGSGSDVRPAAKPPGIGRRLTILFLIGNDQIGDIEDQIARPAIADQELMPGAEAVEHRKPGAIKRNTQSLGRLPAVGMGDEKSQSLAFARFSRSSRSPISISSM